MTKLPASFGESENCRGLIHYTLVPQKSTQTAYRKGCNELDPYTATPFLQRTEKMINWTITNERLAA